MAISLKSNELNNDAASAARTASPMDRTTALIVSELASQIMPPLTDAVSSMDIRPAVREEVEKLSAVLRELVDKETEDRRTLLQPVASAVDEISSLSVICTDAAKFMKPDKARQVLQAVKDVRAELEKLSAASEALRAASEDALKEFKAEADAAAKSVETLRTAVSDEISSGIKALKEPAESLSDELASVRKISSDNAAALKALAEQTASVLDKLSSLPQTPDFSGIEAGISGLRESISTASLSGSKGRASIMEAIASLGANVSDIMETAVKRASERGSYAEPRDDGSLARTLEQALPSWEGLLRAHSQSQTRELDALSGELTHMHKQAEEALLRRLQDSIRDEAIKSTAEWSDRMNAQYQRYEDKIKLIMRLMMGLAAISGIMLLFSLAALIRM